MFRYNISHHRKSKAVICLTAILSLICIKITHVHKIPPAGRTIAYGSYIEKTTPSGETVFFPTDSKADLHNINEIDHCPICNTIVITRIGKVLVLSLFVTLLGVLTPFWHYTRPQKKAINLPDPRGPPYTAL